jgi:GNAT superfamily N-acetyltransferase
MTTISNATFEDVPELKVLVNNAYRGEESKTGWTTEAHILDGPRTDEEMLKAQINTENAAILKYTDKNTQKITGAVYCEVKGNKLYFAMLSVLPAAQGKGIGKALLETIAEYGRQQGCKKLTGSVIGLRRELIDWYLRSGFKYTGHIAPFPTDGKAGIPKFPLELIEIEKDITSNHL